LKSFHERPILHSPYRASALHPSLDQNGQPLGGSVRGATRKRCLLPAISLGFDPRSRAGSDVPMSVVQQNLAKVGVEGSNPFARSSFSQ